MDRFDRSPLNVLFVTSECAPLTKTGGLGDVSAALPEALRGLGLDVRQLLPGYGEVLAKIDSIEKARLNVLGFETRLLEAGPFLIIDCPALLPMTSKSVSELVPMTR